jgi:hypothetical protein
LFDVKNLRPPKTLDPNAPDAAKALRAFAKAAGLRYWRARWCH